MYRICQPPFGFGQWITGFVIGCCGFTGGLALVWPAIFYPKLESGEIDLKLSYIDKANTASFMYIGQIISTIPTSYMQDKFGRRTVLILSINFHLLAWILIYFFHHIWAILTARILMGIWLGFVITTVPSYMAEVASFSTRGRMGTFSPILGLCGLLFQSATGPFISYNAVALTSFIITFSTFLALFNIPESIYSNLRNDKHEKAERNLKWLRSDDDVSRELNRIERYMSSQMARKHNYLEIFKWSATRKAFCQSASLVIIQRLSGFQALSSYTSIILPDSWIKSEHYPIVWNLINLIFLIISLFCVDVIDRKVLLCVSACGSALFALLTSVWFYLHENTDIDMSATLWLPMLGLSIHTAFYAIGYLHLPMVFMGEVFPMNVKSKAASIITLLGIIASVAIVQIFIPLQIYVGNFSNFLLYSIVSVVGIYSSTTIVETRMKPLETIQKILEGREREASMIF